MIDLGAAAARKDERSKVLADVKPALKDVNQILIEAILVIESVHKKVITVQAKLEKETSNGTD